MEAEIKTDKVNRNIEKSRLESQVQAARLGSTRAM